MKKLAVLLAAAPLLLCAPLASSAGAPGAFVLSEAEVDQMARNTHDFNQAIAAGNAADVRRLLSTGITPNIVLENGDTPLTWALRSESWDLARVLLDAQGIDVNMENRHGETPLMLAVIKGREAEFDRLLKLGAKVNKTRGWTPLHYAATEGRTSMMKRLIELGADVNAQTKAGITALDMAARKPSREAVMMLLRAGAYRDYCTDRGMSAADFAKKAGDEELAKYLAVKTCAVTGPTGIAAIDHGADAVYIGGPAFGARQSAGNTMDDIASLAEYAHRYNARVFMALNTLFTNEELPRARSLAFDAAKAGVDVLIVQDMGLMAGPLPDIELHASTQCDIRTPEKAAFLEKAGFSQMVLARELSLAEVAACRAALHSARIEYFIHGALCVSYSGQCYISEAITGRSANRGACAQLCRLPYDVYTESGEQIARRSHVLSLRDNNQTDNLEALIDAGVSSFKIEGRLKDLVYVKNITAWYRQQLDAIIARRPELSRTSDGVSTFSFTPDPEKSFQRSRTDYFVHGRQFAKPYELAQLESPKNTGSPVGCCERVEPGEILVRPAAGVSLANGDGLTYLGDDEEIHGLAVNRADPAGRGLVRLTLRNRRELPEGLRRGMTLMRNLDRSFVRELSGESAVRRIPIVMTFLVEDDALTLIVTDGRECAEAHVAMDLDAPSNPERNRETLIRNLGRLGDTLYTASDIFVPEDLDVFVPASVVNMMRREAVDALTKMREEARVRPGRAPVDDEAPYPDRILGFAANVANDAAREFYERHGARVTAPAFEIKPVEKADLMTCRHCIRAALKRCPKMLKAFPELLEKTPREAFRPEPLVLVNSSGERFEAIFHCKADPCFMTITHADDASGSRSAG